MATEILSLEVKEDGTRVVRRKIDDIGKSSEKADKAVTGLQKDLKNFTNSISPVNALRKALAGIGGALALQSALKQTFVFGKAIAEVSTLVDETVFNMDVLTKAVKEQSIEFGKAPVDQSKALYQIISAGARDSAEAIDTLTAANKLAVGGVTDVATAADGLTTILNGYGDSVGSAADVSDTLFVGVRAGKTTVEELSSSLGKVVPLASSLGVSFDELVAGTAALTKGGIGTAESVTGLRAVLASVAKPTKEASDLANNLGIEFNTAGLQSKGLAGFVADLVDKTDGSEDALSTLFGGVEALVPILALSGEAGDSFNEILDSMNLKAGETEKAFKKMQTPGFRFQQLMSTLQVFVINVGDKLATVLGPAVELLVRNFDDLTIAAGGFLSVFAISKIGAISTYILGLTKSVGGLTLALAANPIGLFAVALSAGVSALVFFRNEIKLTENGFATLNDFIVVSYETIKDFVKSGIDSFRKFISEVDSQFRTPFVDIFDSIVNVTFADFIKGIASGIDFIIGLFKGVGNAIGVGLASSLIRVETMFHNTLNEIKRFFEDSINSIIDGVNRATGSELFSRVDLNIPPDMKENAETLGYEIGEQIAKGLEFSGAQDLLSDIFEKSEERALKRNSGNGPKNSGSPVDGSGDNLPSPDNATGGFDAKTLAAIKSINDELKIESEILGTSSPRARELKDQLFSIKNNLEGQNIFLSEEELESAFVGTLNLNQSLREQVAILDQIKGPQEDYANQTKAISDLINSGQLSGGEASQAIIGAANLVDFDGTQTQMDAFVELHKQTYDQIGELQEKNLISDQTANQLRMKADLELSQERLKNASAFFGALSGLANSENKKLAAIGKAAAITQATIDGVLAVQKALASAPPPAGYALAAAVGVTAAANVAQIATARQLGGDLNSGQLSRVGEGTRPEVFRNSSTGQQFFIPPERGRIEPASAVSNPQKSGSGVESTSGETNQQTNVNVLFDPESMRAVTQSQGFTNDMLEIVEVNAEEIKSRLGF